MNLTVSKIKEDGNILVLGKDLIISTTVTASKLDVMIEKLEAKCVARSLPEGGWESRSD